MAPPVSAKKDLQNWSQVSACDDNYSSEEEWKEIINCDRQRKKSGGSDRSASKSGNGTEAATLSRSSTSSSIGIDESTSRTSSSGNSGVPYPSVPAEKRKWSEMSGCDLCSSDPERDGSSGHCSCDEVLNDAFQSVMRPEGDPTKILLRTFCTTLFLSYSKFSSNA